MLIFIEKLSPLPGFEPGTCPVLSRYATNWALLAWIAQFIDDFLFEVALTFKSKAIYSVIAPPTTKRLGLTALDIDTERG